MDWWKPVHVEKYIKNNYVKRCFIERESKTFSRIKQKENKMTEAKNQTFGEVSWDQNPSGFDKKNNKDLFLRLDDGNNELRLVTQPFQQLVHKYKKDANDKFGQKVACSAIHGSCPVCDMGDKAKPRWLVGVISRKTGTYKVLDISWAVFSSIKNLNQNPKWGDPNLYDINIFVNKNGGATGYYSVQPLPKEPLSASDQLIKDNVDLDDLKRRCTPPTPEQVQKRLDRINGVDGSNGSKTNNNKPVQAPKQVDMSDDGDDEFPAYGSAE